MSSKEIHINVTFTLTCYFSFLFITLCNKFHEFNLDNLYMSEKCVHLSYMHQNCVKIQGFCITGGQGIPREVL